MSFALIPEGILREVSQGSISATSYYVYSVLRCFTTFPTQVELARKCGLSLSAIQKSVASLKKRGWIVAERAREVHGRNLYWICDEPFKKPAEVVSD